MVCLPYPSFRNAPPTVEDGDKALPAAGRARVYPLTCINGSSSATADFQTIVTKCIEQSTISDSDNNGAGKKQKKKLMKESVAMARTFVYTTCGIDASIVHAEMVLRAEDVLASDGVLASCFLDAGCELIVVEVDDESGEGSSSWKALEATRVPRERLAAHFSSVGGAKSALGMEGGIAKRIGTVSVGGLTVGKEEEEARELLEVMGHTKGKSSGRGDGVIKLAVNLSPSSYDGVDRLAEAVASVSKALGEDKGSIAIEDPTAESLGMSYAACLKTDREDGLYTTVVCTRGGVAIGLVYSSKESIVAALQCGRGVYYTRSRAGLWRKGDTSGHFQILHRLDADCDGDALRFTVTQCGEGGGAFCHLETLTCWGPPTGVQHLERTLAQRLVDAPVGSYTKRLFDDDQLLRDKLVEEAQELSEAETPRHVAEELADLLYFAMTRAAKVGVTMDDAQAVLDERARKVTRRKGDSKAFRIEAGEAILKKK